MAGTDSDGEGIHAAFLDKFLNLIRIRQVFADVIISHSDHVLLDAAQLAQFRLDDHVSGVRVFDDFPGDFDILLERPVRGVDHDRCEAVVNKLLARLECVAVVQVDRDGNVRIFLDDHIDYRPEIAVFGIGASAPGNLQNQRSLLFGNRTDDALGDFHVIDIERANRIAVLIRHLEHLPCID